MYRDIPVFNRPIMQKIYKQNQEKHRQRLKNIKRNQSLTKKSNNSNLSLCNRKALFQQQSKKTQIQKQNVMLFNRMLKIMKRDDPNNQPQNNNPNLTMINSNPRTSVNFSRISTENKTLYQRLEKAKPTISNKKLMQDRMKNLNALKFMGKYPNLSASRNYMLLETRLKSNTNYQNHTQTQQKNQNCELDEPLQHKQMEFYRNQFRRMKQRQQNAKDQFNYQSRKQIKSQHYNRQKIIQEEQDQEAQPCPVHHHNRQEIKERNHKTSQINRSRNSSHNQHQITLYRGQHIINAQKMQICIIRHYNKYEIKAICLNPFFGLNKSTSYQLDIPQEQGNQFFGYYDYDYKKIAQMLIIQDGSLVVDIKQDQQKESQQNEREYLNKTDKQYIKKDQQEKLKFQSQRQTQYSQNQKYNLYNQFNIQKQEQLVKQNYQRRDQRKNKQNQSEESQLQAINENIKQTNFGINNGVFQVRNENPIRINMGFANYEQDLDEYIE